MFHASALGRAASCDHQTIRKRLVATAAVTKAEVQIASPAAPLVWREDQLFELHDSRRQDEGSHDTDFSSASAAVTVVVVVREGSYALGAAPPMTPAAAAAAAVCTSTT